MNLLAIDPGPELSAWLHYDAGRVLGFGKVPNTELAAQLRLLGRGRGTPLLVLEMIASYGMAVGSEVFETCVWIGRFIEAFSAPYDRVYRSEVKSHLCHSMKASDTNIRHALIDRFGPGKEKAIGKKKTPGPLYGITKDVWAALAVAVTYEMMKSEEGVWA